MIICLKKQKIFSISNQEKSIKCRRLSSKKDKNLYFDFGDYRPLKELFKDIYYTKLTIEKAEGIQDEFKSHFVSLVEYRPKNLNIKKKK